MAMERFIYRGTEKLRCGYTTGTCAAAAAKAAAEMLLTQHKVTSSALVTPSGVSLLLDVHEPIFSSERASCCIVKDSGDDPDITNGIRVFAEVEKSESGVTILGGKGIGRVTKKGLDQPVGEAAINSVPRRMITEAVREMAEMYEYSGGFTVTVSVPDGEKLAANTFNPRMGIVGGISIIGTTGIVEPMSNSAIIETIRTEANMRRAEGMTTLILSVGNYSDDFISTHAPYLSDKAVTCSNFIGEAIDIGVSMEFENILLIGHIGKLVKLGSGIMNTHSVYADGRMETLIACGALAGT
ncbi:MAG: cobalamin biosynthesis protein CbiD, partial [Ruminococcus sp.]|nr:cobalamin biosynthesis protein CbiD [Ruminococcus sp.]